MRGSNSGEKEDTQSVAPFYTERKPINFQKFCVSMAGVGVAARVYRGN
jgi:hypothetical protein